MKIAWFTPFSKESAIGYYSKLACEALAQNNSIVIFSPEAETLHETSVPVNIFQGDEIIKDLAGYDHVIYNIGDHSLYHAGILSIAYQYPGILILHDLSLLNLMNGYYMLYKNDPAGYNKMISSIYGEDGFNNIFASISDMENWSKVDFLKYNCIEAVTRNAKGIIVHSEYHQKTLKEHFFGPAFVVYFPFQSNKTIKSKIAVNDKLELLTVGHVNYNKRIAQVIEAIGKDDRLRENVHYQVIGKLDNPKYENKLMELISQYNLKDIVTLKGFASKEELTKSYEAADVLINLRKPASEGASWSLVEQMDLGKPIIVNNIGFYSEFPDECLIKLDSDTDSEIEDIRNVLLWVLNNPEEAYKIGQRAKKYLYETFSSNGYAKRVEEILDHLIFLKPVDHLINQLLFEMTAIGITSDMQICSTISEEMEKMFSGH